jgi:hypothetical protein
LCRYGLTHSETDLKAIPESETSDDLERQVLTVMVTGLVDARQRMVELPGGLAEDIARQAFNRGLTGRLRLALKAAQATLAEGPALRPEWDSPPALVDEKDHSRVFVIRAAGKGDIVQSADKRSLHMLMLSNWPDRAPE